MTCAPSETTLDATHPDLAEQLLTPFDPRQFDADSQTPVWWRGPLGHVWRATVAERTQGRGCPVCEPRQSPAAGRSLEDVAPAVARDADGWDPSRVSAGSRATMPWRCHDCGTTWMAEIRARAHGYRGCPTCRRTARPPIAVTHPELAQQMVKPFDPNQYTHGSKAVVRWRGPAGHEWDATVSNRVKGSGCPVCSRVAAARARQAPPPGGSLVELYPHVAAEAHGWNPADYTAKSSARMPWQCSACGHEWTATIYARTQRTGCPACARTKRRRP